MPAKERSVGHRYSGVAAPGNLLTNRRVFLIKSVDCGNDSPSHGHCLRNIPDFLLRAGEFGYRHTMAGLWASVRLPGLMSG